MTSFTRKKTPEHCDWCKISKYCDMINARYIPLCGNLIDARYIPYRPKHPNSLLHEQVGPHARKPEGAFKKGPAERSVKTAISRVSFFPFCKPSPNTTKLELDLLTSEILARLERWSLMRLQNSTINNVVRDRLDNYVEKLAFPSCTLRRDVKMAADDRSVVLRIKRKRTEDPLDALREFISYTL